MGTLALVLAAVVLAMATRRPLVPIDQPVSGIVSTSQLLAVSTLAAWLRKTAASGTSSNRAKGGVAQIGTWENVGIGGNAPALQPEVVVSLEEVDFCKGEIVAGVERAQQHGRRKRGAAADCREYRGERPAAERLPDRRPEIAAAADQRRATQQGPRHCGDRAAVANLNAKVLRIKPARCPLAKLPDRTDQRRRQSRPE
ncbi:MAG: hypothetical protein U0Z44_08985 [Kouleothrix sp.]